MCSWSLVLKVKDIRCKCGIYRRVIMCYSWSIVLKVEGRELERVMIVKLLEAIANSLDQVIILFCVLCSVMIGYVN
jgi:hypothetical protein